MQSFFDMGGNLTAQDIIESPDFEVSLDWLNKVSSVEYGEEALLNWAETLGFQYTPNEEFPDFLPVGACIEYILKHSQPKKAKSKSKAKSKRKKQTKAEANAQRLMIRKHIIPFGA